MTIRHKTQCDVLCTLHHSLITNHIKMTYTAKDIAKMIKGTVEGDENALIWKPCKIEEVEEGGITFLANPKYGGKDGKYVILEGSDREKKVSETDADEAMVAESFNDKYQMLSSLDLTNDENYAQVTAFMDVELSLL